MDSQAHLQKTMEVLVAEDPVEDTLKWLQNCATGDVKNVDLLNDLPILLKREGFLDCEAKYVGGFRFLIQSHSSEAINKILVEGKEKLSHWFTWISPWSINTERVRPGRLVWLSVEGIPLHAWTSKNFNHIGSKFGKVVEVEEFTTSRQQVHLGRVFVHTADTNFINEVINFSVEGEIFRVKIMEDLIEIIDSGPRYKTEETQSRSSLRSGNDISERASEEGSEDNNLIPGSPQIDVAADTPKGRVVPSLATLNLVKTLNAEHALHPMVETIISDIGVGQPMSSTKDTIESNSERPTDVVRLTLNKAPPKLSLCDPAKLNTGGPPPS